MICAICKTMVVDEDDYSSCDCCQKVFCSHCSYDLRTVGCEHTICRFCTAWHPVDWDENGWDDNEGEGWESCPLCGAEIAPSLKDA